MQRNQYHYICYECGHAWVSLLEDPDDCKACGSTLCGRGEPLDDTSPLPIPVWKRFENGRTECEVHNAPFQSGIANVAYGLFEFQTEYTDAKQALFPHANSWLMGGCVSSDVEVVEVDYCQECRDAETLWRRATSNLSEESPSEKL